MKHLIILALFFLVSCGGGGSSGTEAPPGFEPTCEHKRGLSLFALMNPNFPVSDAQHLLKTSCNPALGILPDVFGSDDTNYHTVVSDYEQLTVTLYVTCGPCRQPRRDGSVVVFRPDLNIPQLNNGIVYDPQVRADYEARVQNLVERFVVPYPQFEFIIIPELEDSQTSDAAQAFYDLTVSHIPEGYNAFVAKNPVNNWDRYNGILEIHTEQLSETGHLVSNDRNE